MAVEVSEEWIRSNSSEDYVRVDAGSTEHVLLAEENWIEVTFRVRSAGADVVGEAWTVRQGVDDVPGDGRFDVVVPFGPEGCEGL